MNRADRLAWWRTQIEAARHAVTAGAEARRSRNSSAAGAEEGRAGTWRVAPLGAPSEAHVLLSGATISGDLDEERRRRLPWVRGRGASGARAGAQSLAVSADGGGLSSKGSGQGGGLDRARQLAGGYQPAVVKIVSFAHGSRRATATGQYVQRQDVPLETHDGRLLADREAVADEIKAWSAGFSKRAESQDVGTFVLKLRDVPDAPDGRAAYQKVIAAGFAGHRFAARIDAAPSGALEARIVVALAGLDKERFRIRDARPAGEGREALPRRLDSVSDVAVKARIETATGIAANAVSILPGRTSHGRDGVVRQLNKLLETGLAVDDHGKALGITADARLAAREWGNSLRSQSARDTMHLIISAKAGTDPAALTRAARAFLHDRFADHKFMFGVHTDKETEGHIHAHAVITVKNESGQKIHPGPETFREWRQAYAQHAQAEGLKIVATSARERASSQSYGPKDKAIVDAADRPRPAREARDRAYAADPANRQLIDRARRRIETARANPIRLPITGHDRQALAENLASWQGIVAAEPHNNVAKDMFDRLAMAQALGAILQTVAKRVDYLSQGDRDVAITSAQMVKDLGLMNEAVGRTSDLLEGETKQRFREASARYLETLANRIDLQRAQERGVQEMTRAEIEAIAGVNADRLIARAQEIRAQETREAQSAERLADRAIETERRREAPGVSAPQPQRELSAERAMVRGFERSAALESREAAAAVEAARVIAEHTAQPLSPTLVETDSLAKLRAEQERLIREMEAERASAQSQKAQRMT